MDIYDVTVSYPYNSFYIHDWDFDDLTKDQREKFEYVKKNVSTFKKWGNTWFISNNITAKYHFNDNNITYENSNGLINKTITLDKSGFIDKIETIQIEKVYQKNYISEETSNITRNFKRDENHNLIKYSYNNKVMIKHLVGSGKNKDEYNTLFSYKWDNNNNLISRTQGEGTYSFERNLLKYYINYENNTNVDLNALMYDFTCEYYDAYGEECLLPIGLKSTNLIFNLTNYKKNEDHEIKLDNLNRIISFVVRTDLSKELYQFTITYL